MDFSHFSQLDLEEIERQLTTDIKNGLSRKEAIRRKNLDGQNQLEDIGASWWQILMRQFKSSFVFLLLAAAVLAFILGERIDAILIGSFVLINAFLGFAQEFRSETTINALKKLTTGRAQVRRNGKEETIDVAGLVVGDVVILETGDICPADVRLIGVHNFLVDESILTGESLQVGKIADRIPEPVTQPHEARNVVFKGTSILNGRAEGIVIAIGMETALGDISRIISETKKESAFQKNIQKISKFIIGLVVVTLVLVLLIQYFLAGGTARSFTDSLIFSIALAVGVIPEALPLVTTFSLSNGARKLSLKKVVVKRLTSIEDLGSIQVLCTDKTGTITKNQLTVADTYQIKPSCDPVFIGAMAISNFLEKQVLPNNAFDLALLEKLDQAAKDKLQHGKILNAIPFDPTRRRNSVLVENEGEKEIIVRGSPEEMIALDENLSPTEKREVLEWIRSQGRLGRRTLAISMVPWTATESDYDESTEATNISICGIVSFVDSLKPTTKSVIAKANELGVRLVVLTGDDPVVAGAVGVEANIIDDPGDVITGAEFDVHSDAEKFGLVQKYSIFARVSPRQKFEIIKLLQENFLTGFLGEGINDAPALKAADVAIVVESASDIARDTADIVLLEHDLGVIIDGIVEGRKTFYNTVTYIRATLLSNFGNFYAVAFASLIIPFLPMLPVQILLLNLLSDFPMISISMDNVNETRLRRPTSYNTKGILVLASILGIVSTLFDFIIFGTFLRMGEGILQTNWFIGSVATELVLLFSIRTDKFLFNADTKPSLPIVVLTLFAFIAALFIPFTGFGAKIFHFVRPDWNHLALLLLIVAGYLVVTEIVKKLYYRYLED